MKLIGLLTFIISICLLILSEFYRSFRRNRKFTICLILIIFGLSNKLLQSSCSEWKKGLFGKEIENSKEFCRVTYPQYCILSLFESLTDFTRFFSSSSSCEGSRGDIETYKEFFYYQNNSKDSSKEFKFIAFDNTAFFSEAMRVSTKDGFQKNIFKGTHGFETLQDAFESGREIVLDLENMKYHFNVTRNNPLIEKRKEEL